MERFAQLGQDIGKLWEKYSREYEYAKDISFEDTCNTIQMIMDAIKQKRES